MVGSGRRVTPARLGLLLLGRSGVLDRLALNASRCSLMFASTFAWKYDRIFLNMFYKIVKPTQLCSSDSHNKIDKTTYECK